MRDPQDTKTNAADSAPGVDDGKIRGEGPSINTKPGGRRLAWLVVGLALVILAIVFIARPQTTAERAEQAQLTEPTAVAEMAPAPQPAAEAP